MLQMSTMILMLQNPVEFIFNLQDIILELKTNEVKIGKWTNKRYQMVNEATSNSPLMV